jgi:hypothetical protein
MLRRARRNITVRRLREESERKPAQSREPGREPERIPQARPTLDEPKNLREGASHNFFRSCLALSCDVINIGADCYHQIDQTKNDVTY